MLYLTSFKIAADFLNNLNFLNISLQVHIQSWSYRSNYSSMIQLIFPEKKFCFSSHLAETDNIVN